jgi:uncharacterized protein
METTVPTVGGVSTPSYILHCTDGDGEEVRLIYSPHESILWDESGMPLLSDVLPASHGVALAVSPATPGWKSTAPATLKIQLGMSCNYSCSYCNQASQADAGAVTRTADADKFLASLDHWLDGAPERIEFWGGEPLLYFAKLKRLVPALRQRFPATNFTLVTNGSLLDEEILSFVERHDIFMSISHDGPGQHLRGPDHFDDSERATWLRELWRRRGGAVGRVAFNFVLTPANSDVQATRRWLAEKIGDDDLLTDTEGVVCVYDKDTLHGPGRWDEQDYARLAQSIVDGFVNGNALKIRDLTRRAQDFVDSLRTRRPASALGQKCGMDRPDQLAVDLKGQVMTCQNTGAEGKHRLGHVDALSDVKLDTATHWSHRESCRYCPVVQLCKGSCMYLDDDLFAESCENEYRFNVAVLGGVLQRLTGLKLQSITGEIRRPKARRVIKVATA